MFFFRALKIPISNEEIEWCKNNKNLKKKTRNTIDLSFKRLSVKKKYACIPPTSK